MICASRWLVSLLPLAAVPGRASEPPTLDGLRSEASRRSQALVRQGFTLTQSIAMKGKGEGSGVTRLNLVFPPASGDTKLDLWLQTLAGEAVVKLLGPDGSA